MNSTTERPSGSHKACPFCGGMMHYDIHSGMLKCQRCAKLLDLAIYDDIESDEDKSKMAVVEYSCPPCGTAVHTTQTNMVSYCSFCGSQVMFTERMTNTRRPDRIEPFRITREKCEEIYSQRMNAAKLPRTLPARPSRRPISNRSMYLFTTIDWVGEKKLVASRKNKIRSSGGGSGGGIGF